MDDGFAWFMAAMLALGLLFGFSTPKGMAQEPCESGPLSGYGAECQRPKFDPPPPPRPAPRQEPFNPGPPSSGVDCLSPPMPPGADQWDRWSRDMDFWRCMRKRHGIEPDQPTTPWPGPSRLPK